MKAVGNVDDSMKGMLSSIMAVMKMHIIASHLSGLGSNAKRHSGWLVPLMWPYSLIAIIMTLYWSNAGTWAFCLPRLSLCDTHAGKSELGSEGQPPGVKGSPPAEACIELRDKSLTKGPTDMTILPRLGSNLLGTSPLSHTLHTLLLFVNVCPTMDS